MDDPPSVSFGEEMIRSKDINDLFDILAAYRKNDPHLQDKSTKATWFLSLKPYEKADIQEAIGAWFRKSKYWPEPSEIAALCPALPEPDREPGEIGAAARDYHRYMDPLWARYDAVKKRRREAGVPATVLEARRAGLSDREWCALLAERGL